MLITRADGKFARVECKLYKYGSSRCIHKHSGSRCVEYDLPGTCVTVGMELENKKGKGSWVYKFELMTGNKPWGFLIEKWTVPVYRTVHPNFHCVLFRNGKFWGVYKHSGEQRKEYQIRKLVIKLGKVIKQEDGYAEFELLHEDKPWGRLERRGYGPNKRS